MATSQPPQDSTAWHTLTVDDAIGRLRVNPALGLSSSEVRERRARSGENVIEEPPGRTVLAMFLGQFKNFMILILIAAAIVSGLIGEPKDALAIVVILVLNAAIGVVQESRAERAVAALRRLAAPEARVLREGRIRSLPASAIVPGDIIALESGDIIPADLRLTEAVELQTDESALTGESQATEKGIEPNTETAAALGDRRCLAFRGTIVTRGRGRGVAVATGMTSEIGRIADLLRHEEIVRTPLQRRLETFGRRLALAILSICGIVFVLGLVRGGDLILMFLTAVSLAVAAIPEALPAVVTVSLAFGARGMSTRKALIRRLPAVETLGSVTFICSDKTGTLTENQMRVERIVVEGDIHENPPTQWREQTTWLWLLRAMALSNDVALGEHDQAFGEPTELALYEAARRAGLHKHDIENDWIRVAEIPFESARQCMSTLHRSGDSCVIFTKGAPESVLPICTKVMVGGKLRALSEGPWLTKAASLAEGGYRVLAIACRRIDTVPEALTSETVENDLVLLGLVALIDPPREEAYQAVQDCLAAGITPVMITGDHPGTALAIARRLGIATSEDTIVTGPQLSALSDAALSERVEDARIYARVDPQQKIRIVKALQERGQFAAMTGDGVNDAPALRRADIGVAMGLTGTDVAREAAGMVLLDDNFATIVSAVREGRRIFDNIRKFIKDTMSSNSGEIWTLLLAPMFGLPIPLLPIHILWINLVTDGLPGLAFSAEPAERGYHAADRRAPRRENIFAHGMWQHIIWYGLFVGGVSIASQAWAMDRGVEYWQTVVFTVLTVSQLFHSMAVRSETESILSIGLTSNRFMLFAVLLTVALQLMIIYVPALNAIFRTQPLPLLDLAVCLLLSSLTLVAVEAEKAMVRAGWIYRSRPDNG